MAQLEFKVATTPTESEAIHRLNHRTFVDEIPQHEARADGRLIDKFHDENTYVIAKHGNDVIGMVALRLERPFSLDGRMPDLDAHLPRGRHWCEVRLLAVERVWRGTPVLVGLVREVLRILGERARDAVVITATTRQLKLYRHFGFVPFGPLVGTALASFQPMYLTAERFVDQAPALGFGVTKNVNLLPGPVQMAAPVTEAFCGPPQSHREASFMTMVDQVRDRLCALTGARHAALLFGSGTLANEVVCGQLSRLEAPGLVLSCGEFGERLADHARRAWLPHEHLALPWGHAIELPKLAAWLDRHPEIEWLWTAHCETSTGALVDVAALGALCDRRGIKLALDAVSTVGVMSLNLDGVWMASATSGKGLAAYPGIAIVLHRDPVEPAPEKLPRYLDLGLYATGEGVPFTISSNLMAALAAALEHTDWPARYARIAALHDMAAPELAALGYRLAGPWPATSPAVITFALPENGDASAYADRMEEAGVKLSARSGYLRERNWLQACFMGDLAEPDVAYFLATVRKLAKSARVHRFAHAPVNEG
jgi:aspartate aminotransferase-like enzyme/predicted N-acetyltransferase YhbS